MEWVSGSRFSHRRTLYRGLNEFLSVLPTFIVQFGWNTIQQPSTWRFFLSMSSSYAQRKSHCAYGCQWNCFYTCTAKPPVSCVTGHTACSHVRDLVLPPSCQWDIRSSGTLRRRRSVGSYGSFGIVPVFKGQDEDETVRLARNVGE